MSVFEVAQSVTSRIALRSASTCSHREKETFLRRASIRALSMMTNSWLV